MARACPLLVEAEHIGLRYMYSLWLTITCCAFPPRRGRGGTGRLRVRVPFLFDVVQVDCPIEIRSVGYGKLIGCSLAGYNVLHTPHNVFAPITCVINLEPIPLDAR